ncbi:MAG TPA: 3-hydroxyacyl-CoA dehydrogenase NAD-binding domain-containing protein [Syntrophobacteraceae bacterium]|nr:3-hydroxyacyl-CoA dehydrogenase NAD-binding domain-containing protein [Syntrophobacteraceae bacterium]
MAEPITLFHTHFYDSPAGKIAIVTMDNGHDYKKPNTFSQASISSLNEALDRLGAEDGVKGLMLTGKPYIFAAGADLSVVPFVSSFQQGYAIGKAGHEAMKRIMDLDYPTLAAINGAALGGGLEISLYCKYRTVARTVSSIGFPECFIGLVPGWGGCTLTTRLIGPQKAIELIVFNALNQNRMIGGTEAFELGLADRVFEGVEFLDESLALLVSIVAGETGIERAQASTVGAGPAREGELSEMIARGRAFVDSKVHGAAPAPYRALELIQGACSWDLERGFEEENKALGDLIKTRQCKASIYSFDLLSRYAKKPRGVPETKPPRVSRVGLIGAGLMASQLAHLFIDRLGLPVVMKDVKQEFVDKGVGYVHEQFEKSARKGRISETRARYLAGLVHGTLDTGDFADCDFVIEAVFEEMAVKKKVFAEVESVISPEAVLATNTSSLSVTEMASELKNPQRVVGFHFFNPVAVMPLVEIAKAQKTGDPALATAFDLAKKLRKTAILVKDSPGFLVNRILMRNLCDCVTMVDRGASFEEVDRAMIELGLPMAPFEILDMVGLPVAFHVNEVLCNAFGSERFPLSENLKRLVKAGSPGIYVRGEKRVDPEVEKLWVKEQNKTFHPEEIREIALSSLAREVDLILQEKIVEGPKEVDLAMITGAGWPFFMGGVTMYLDLTGIAPKTLQKVFFGS